MEWRCWIVARGCWGVEMVGKRRGSGDDVARQQHNKQNNPQSRERERERDLLETEQREREKHDSAG